MAIVERNDGKPFIICNDTMEAYAGPGTRIYRSMREFNEAKGITPSVLRPASRLVLADQNRQPNTLGTPVVRSNR